MSNLKLADSLANLGRALERLREGLDAEQPPPLVVDGTIQRFEFVVDDDAQGGATEGVSGRLAAR